MKKLLTLLLAVVLLVTTFVLSACDDEEEGADIQIDVESSSSSVSRDRGDAEKGSMPSFSDVVPIDPYSSPIEPSSDLGSSNSVSIPEFVNTGSVVVIPQTPVDESLDNTVKNAINAINSIGTVAYSSACKDRIDYAEYVYNLVDASLKSGVTNFGDIAVAKNAYAALQNQAAQFYVDKFKNAVTALGAFEYTTTYKSKLDNCDGLYEAIAENLKSSASSEKTTLDNLKTQYNDITVSDSFMTLYNATTIPSPVTSISTANKGPVQILITRYNALTTSQKSLVANKNSNIASQMSEYDNHIKSNFPSALWAIDDNNYARTPVQIGNSVFKFDIELGSCSDERKGEQTMSFSDGRTFTKWARISKNELGKDGMTLKIKKSDGKPDGKNKEYFQGTMKVYVMGEGTITINGQTHNVVSTGSICSFDMNLTTEFKSSTTGFVYFYAAEIS